MANILFFVIQFRLASTISDVAAQNKIKRKSLHYYYKHNGINLFELIRWLENSKL